MLHKVVALTLCGAAAALAAGGAARGDVAGPSATTVALALKAKHGSKTTGTATLTPARTAAGDGIRVVLKVKGPVRGSLPAHIHTGPCKREPTFANPRIWTSLTDVVRGKSVTSLSGATLERLQAKPFSINVHAPSYDVIACGDIPRA